MSDKGSQRRKGEKGETFRVRQGLSTTEGRKKGDFPCPTRALNDGREKKARPSVFDKGSQRRKGEKKVTFRVRQGLSTTEGRKKRALPCPIEALNDGREKKASSSVSDKGSQQRKGAKKKSFRV